MTIRAKLTGRESLRTYGFHQSMMLMGPLIMLLLVFYLYPLIKLFAESFIIGGQFSWEHYYHFFREPMYRKILIRTIKFAVYVTILCFVIGYPIAYFLARIRSQILCNILMIGVLLPFFTSVLVRSYAWIVILRTKGIINSFLLSIGFINEPLDILYNEFSVIVGMTHIMLPFMVLPIFSVLKNIDPRLLRAARNLGANAKRAFALITFPLSLPGVGAGVMFTFIISLGFFIVPALLGGPKTLLISTLIAQQINFFANWEFAGAISVILLMTTIIMVIVFDKIVGLEKIYSE
jgi:ABC-type spermidine/putrescine transport system permease subunit I